MSRSQLKVAYISQQGINLEDSSGGIIHVKAIVRNLKNIGCECEYFSLNNNSKKVIASEDMISIHELSQRIAGNNLFRVGESAVRKLQTILHFPYFSLFDNFRFYECLYIAGKKFDIFHERLQPLSIAGVLTAKKLGKPIVVEVNADYLEEQDLYFREIAGIQRVVLVNIFKYNLQNADQIICVSRGLRDHLVKKWSVDPTKLHIFPNGADVEDYDPNIASEDAKHHLGMTHDPIIMFVGGFYPWHAPFDLIDSMRIVIERNSSAQLYMIGDGPLLEESKLYTRKNGLDQNIHFLGRVLHEKIPSLLPAADVLVSPVKLVKGANEGWWSPLKLFEYMAASRAIVATRTGQTAEVIKDGYNGLLADPGDISGFAHCISQLLEDGGLRLKLGKQARDDVVQNFSWKSYAEGLVNIYKSIL